jgi:asparagine synthase (glutamine-hydrolysing)
LLDDAIRIRLRADVPIGCYLSGGLDSSGITSLVKNKFNNRLRTFGIRFEQGEFDEGKYQEGMVDVLKTDHTNLQVTNENIGAVFPDVIWHCEKPLLRTAPAPLFMLSKTVRDNGFKVVLTGEGADEVFGGYNIFRETLVRKFWARQPASRLRPLLIGKLYPYIFNEPRLKHTLQAFFAKGMENTEDPIYSHLIRWENTSRAKVFFSDDLQAAIGRYSGYEELKANLPETFDRWDPLSKAQFLEMQLFMSNYLLSSQGDRVAMAHSVEIRLPYLDYRIIEFMGRIPPKLKIRGLKEKDILKKVFRGVLPEVILNRPKHPYRAPIQQSLLNGSGDGSADLLSPDSLAAAGLFDGIRVEKLLSKLRKTNHASEVEGMALAGILSTQILFQEFGTFFKCNLPHGILPTVFMDRRTVA